MRKLYIFNIVGERWMRYLAQSFTHGIAPHIPLGVLFLLWRCFSLLIEKEGSLCISFCRLLVLLLWLRSSPELKFGLRVGLLCSLIFTLWRSYRLNWQTWTLSSSISRSLGVGLDETEWPWLLWTKWVGEALMLLRDRVCAWALLGSTFTQFSLCQDPTDSHPSLWATIILSRLAIFQPLQTVCKNSRWPFPQTAAIVWA